MIRDRVLGAIRRWNRTWLDRLDPDYPPPEPPRPDVTVYAEPTPNPEAMKFVASVQVPALSVDHPLQRAVDGGSAELLVFLTHQVDQVVGAEMAVLVQENVDDQIAFAGALAAGWA